MVGKHVIKTWSSTLASVSLSSGEAEFYGVVRASGMGLGYQSLLSDYGVSIPLRIWTDSTAAVGICSRQGLGGQRHIDTHSLWVQQGLRSNRFTLHKVDGSVNPADLFTKHVPSREKLGQLTRLFGCSFPEGRAESAPAMKKAAGNRRTMADAEVNAIEEGAIITPHVYGDGFVRDKYPAVIPEGEPSADADFPWSEDLLGKGAAIARGIMEEASIRGRVRITTGRGDYHNGR